MMVMELRMEQHDTKCERCHEPRSSSQECAPCTLENAKIGAAGESGLDRLILDIEVGRNKRLRENMRNAKEDE